MFQKGLILITIISFAGINKSEGQSRGTFVLEPSLVLINAKNSKEIKNQYTNSDPLLKTFLSYEKFKCGASYGIGFGYFLRDNLGILMSINNLTTQYFHSGKIFYDTLTNAVDLIQDYNFLSFGLGLRKSIPINNVVSLNADYTFSYWQHINHSDGHLLTLKKSHIYHSINVGFGIKLNKVISLNPGLMAGLSQGDMAAQSNDNMIDFKPIFFGLGIKLQIKLANKYKS